MSKEKQSTTVSACKIKETIADVVKQETESTDSDKKSKRENIDTPVDAKKALDEVHAIKKAKDGTQWKDGSGRTYTKKDGSLVRDADGKILKDRYHILWSWTQI